jgi:hypothetical protein
MKRGIQVDVPQHGQDRLDELTVLRDAALDAAKATQSRINLLTGETEGAMRQRLAADLNKHTRCQNDFMRLLSACNQWLIQLRLAPGQCLAPVTIAGDPPDGESAAEAITHIRGLIAALGRKIHEVKRAPIKHGSQRQAVISHLAYLAQRVRPRLNVDRNGKAHVVWAEDLIADKNDLLGLFALICPGETLAMFAIDEKPEPADALTPSEREEKLSKLADELLELERKEVALLSLAEGMLPRPETNPMAYLQVQIMEDVSQETSNEAAVA